MAENLFAPLRRQCRCGAARVDTSDIISKGMLHGLLFCFALSRASTPSHTIMKG